MSGPIVRSGPIPEFSRNGDSVFTKKAGTKTAAKTATASKAKKSAPKKKKKGGK